MIQYQGKDLEQLSLEETIEFEKQMLKKVLSYIHIAFCWIIIAPLNIFITRERELTVVIGKLSGEIADNTKYLLIHGIRENKNIRFLTQSAAVLNANSDIKKHIVLFGSLKGVLTLLRASQIVRSCTSSACSRPRSRVTSRRTLGDARV
mgnify:CR=1 FL=1